MKPPFKTSPKSLSTNIGGYRYFFNGQEGDNEVYGEVANFGYEFRQYDSRLGRWWSVDPKWNEYPSVSPYVFCNGSPIVLMDMKGKESSPIYDLQGNFLGTDNEGLQGEKILMHKDHFKQGMDHNAAKLIETTDRGMFEVSAEAEGRSSYHHDMLYKRPDWDGVVTIAEGIAWAKSHAFAKYAPTPDNTLYLDASKLDFGSLSVSNIGLKEGESEIKNLYSYVNPLSQASIRTTYALGNTQIKLIDESQGLVQLFGDTYDWDYHNAFVNGIPQGKRDMLIYFERIRINVNDAHGFPIKFYGIGKIKMR